jgi:hypothetical protein
VNFISKHMYVYLSGARRDVKLGMECDLASVTVEAGHRSSVNNAL